MPKYRTCSKCSLDKPTNAFFKDKSKSDGFRKSCIICDKQRKLGKSRTKVGLLCNIYTRQKQKSVSRGHNTPSYTKDDLIAWAMAQIVFHRLFDNWKRLDYQTDYVPSVDRKDDYIGYTIDNIQLMTWKDNNEKGYLDRVRGKNNKGSRPVGQYSLSGNLICIFPSSSIASRELGISQGNISTVASDNSKYTKAGGFQWSFSLESKIPKAKFKRKTTIKNKKELL